MLPPPTLSRDDLRTGARLLWDLPGFVRRPVTLQAARGTLRRWQAQRAESFLELARWAIYDNPSSPYLRLLNLAGCTHGDLWRLVDQEGLEGALQRLFRAGVFLTVAEFKGRLPVVRGSVSFELDPRSLRNPRLPSHLLAQTGGSGGSRIEVPLNLAAFRDRAIGLRVLFEALGGSRWRMGLWSVPGGAAIRNALECTLCGLPPVAWFWRVDPRALEPRYRWSLALLRLGALLGGQRLPAPRYVPIQHPRPVLDWLIATLRAGESPYLRVPASSAVRLCELALEAGIQLRGTWFQLGGEPTTPVRRAAIERAGASALPMYGSVDASQMAYGCLAPEAADELHLLQDQLAMIQPGEHQARGAEGGPAAALPAHALLLTRIRPTAPLIMLNTSLGDQAWLGDRDCGCSLQAAGWTTHLSEVRSFEKLTAGGMTFLDLDVIRVLEEVLPARFGGGPTDYQLIEAELETGRPTPRVRVHPRLGSLDEAALRDTFLSAIGAQSAATRVMELNWRESGWLTVEREAPVLSPAGKILHLHRAAAAGQPAG